MNAAVALQPIVAVYRAALQPIGPLAALGIGVSTLDLVAMVRLCVAMRQFREGLRAAHIAKRKVAPTKAKGKGKAAAVQTHEDEEDHSFVRDAAATLVVVYGGETVAAPMLGMPPSYMVSGVFPLLYTGVQAIVEYLPAVPTPSLVTELPLAIVDAFARAFLLCSLIPPTVVANAQPALASSPWTLLLTSLVTANGGFFLANLFSFFHPTPLRVATPSELLPYGWTTADLWCAPLVTGLFALLTHAQPFWADAHALLVRAAFPYAAGAGAESEKGPAAAQPLDAELARAVCAALLAVVVTTRAAKNFGAAAVVGGWAEKRRAGGTAEGEKEKLE